MTLLNLLSRSTQEFLILVPARILTVEFNESCIVVINCILSRKLGRIVPGFLYSNQILILLREWNV
jgi:hypothetical protein